MQEKAKKIVLDYINNHLVEDPTVKMNEFLSSGFARRYKIGNV